MNNLSRLLGHGSLVGHQRLPRSCRRPHSPDAGQPGVYAPPPSSPTGLCDWRGIHRETIATLIDGFRYLARSVSVMSAPMMVPPMSVTTTADGQNPITTSSRAMWRRKR